MANHSPTLSDLAALNAELAALVRARIPLEASLRRLGRQLPRDAGALAKRLGERMEQGASLAESIEMEGDSLPEMYKSVVTVGLASSEPASALQTVADSAARLASLRKTTGVALIAPVIVVCLASVLYGFLFLRVFSEAVWVAPDSLSTIEAWTRSPTVKLLFQSLIPLLVVGIPLIWWWRSSGARSLDAPRWSLFGWIPGARQLHRLNASATLAEVLRIGIAAGLPWGEAMRNAGRASGDRLFQRAADELAEHLNTGKPLSEASAQVTASIDQLPPLVKAVLKSMEHRAHATASLDRAAQTYLRRAEALHDSLSGWLPAVLSFGVAGSVAAVYCLALAWPYAEMLKTVSQAMWR